MNKLISQNKLATLLVVIMVMMGAVIGVLANSRSSSETQTVVIEESSNTQEAIEQNSQKTDLKLEAEMEELKKENARLQEESRQFYEKENARLKQELIDKAREEESFTRKIVREESYEIKSKVGIDNDKLQEQLNKAYENLEIVQDQMKNLKDIAESTFKAVKAGQEKNDSENLKAIEEANELLEQNNQDSMAYASRSGGKVNIGDYLGAIEDANKAIELSPDNEVAIFNRAYAYNELGKYDEAIADYNEVISLTPLDATSYNNLGVAYEGKGNKELAYEKYLMSVELSPENPQFLLNLSNLTRDMISYQDSLILYDQVFDLMPEDWFLEDWFYSSRGYANFMLANDQKAIDDYNIAISLNPNVAEYYFNRGMSYYYIQQDSFALSNFTSALSKYPEKNENYLEALYMRGAIYSLLGENDNSLRDLSEVLTISPNYAEALSQRGYVYGVMGQYYNAVDDLSKAIIYGGGASGIDNDYENRALSYYDLGDWDNCINDFSKIIQFGNYPYIDKAHYYRGLCFFNSSKNDYALSDFINSDGYENAQEFINYIRSTDSQVNAAAVINNKDPQSRENYIQALENCEYSINLDPTNPEAYICKGAALIHLGDYQESVLALNMAIDLDPSGIWGYGNRAISYELMGLNDKSNLDFDKVINLNPDNYESYMLLGLANEVIAEKLESYNLKKSLQFYGNSEENFEIALIFDANSSRSSEGLLRVVERINYLNNNYEFD